MDFPREELLIKYVRIYEQWIACGFVAGNLIRGVLFGVILDGDAKK